MYHTVIKVERLVGIIIPVLLIFSTLFLSSDFFVSKEIQPKIYSFIFFSLVSGIVVSRNKERWLKIDALSLALFFFWAYLFICNLIVFPLGLNPTILISSLLLYLFFRYENGHYSAHSIFNVLILAFCFIQASYGLLQYLHIIHSTSNFPIIGSFDNPAGFAACLAVAFPLSFLFFKHPRYYKLLAIFSAVTVAVAVVLSESRAGVVSIGVVTAIFLYSMYKNKPGRFRKYVILFFVVIGIAIFTLSLFLKKESASGRVLIWDVTWEMIKEAPVSGHGSDAFLAKYMDYQAGYFAQNPQSNYAILADNVLHPFNEYLRLTAEYGCIGLALLLVVIFFVLKHEKVNSPYMLCLISLGVFSLFSYPLKYPFVWVITVYCLAQISKNRESVPVISFSGNRWVKFSVILCAIVGIGILFRDMTFEYRWNKTAKASLLGKTEKMIPQYEQLYNRWNHNHLFLYNYGAELNYIKEYEKSNIILHECEKYYNDYDIQILLADNLFNLGKWVDSKRHYNRALNMCPNRFVPLSQLHQIALLENDSKEARRIALLILDKPIKIPSATVHKIKYEMQQYLGK